MRHLSIRGRLIAALIIFTTIFTSFGAFTILKIRELEGVTTNIYDDPLKVSSAAIEARVDIIKMQRQVKDILLQTDEEERQKEEIELFVIEDKIYDNLDNIKESSINGESLDLEQRTREIFIRWRKNHELMMDYIQSGNTKAAMELSMSANASLVNYMEANLKQIDENSKKRAAELVNKANDLQNELELLLIILNIGIVAFFTLLFSFVIRSIIQSIKRLQYTMNESAATGILKDAEMVGDNEIDHIAKHYNVLLQKLRNQFWLKDGQNSLNQEISAATSLKDMTQRSLSFIVKNLGVGKGALYLYNESTKQLELHASYAFTEREQRFGSYALGEGIVGQTAMDKKPICLENIKDYEGYISTGVTLEAAINIYAFPLLYDNNLHGVVELASFEGFDELKREFLKEIGKIIAANVYGELQTQKVKNLLEISERSQMEARYSASQLLRTNHLLEEQQLRLQQQSEELQQTNAELEEQQQQLQQQSEELQQTNAQLEEQQLMLEEQTKLLNVRNLQLESSRQDLLKHSRELEAANKYKSQFLANMSHELRTPLNSIILLSRLLMKDEKKTMNENQLEKLEVIYGSGQELLRLINDVLDLSKIEAGKMDVSCEEFHTRDLVSGVRGLFDSAAREKNIELQCIDHVNTKINGDFNKIAQVVRNLLSNAIKFTGQGKVRLEIKADNDSDIKMIVTDTGIGISKENIKRIFEEFQQGDGSVSRKYGGTGLGLSISRKLANVMNGEVFVESEEGKGSCFTLLLKDILKHKVQKSETTDAVEHAGELLLEEAAAARDEKETILIIEDDPVFASFVREICESMGFTSIVATRGSDGIEIAKNNAIDAILLDLTLPDMGGMEVLRELKSTQELKHIPVHVVSARDRNNAAQKIGAVGYKQKPLGEEEIAEIIVGMIDKKANRIKKLLIIEDNEVHCNAMRELLQSTNILIDTVDSEEAAKEQIQTIDYDAVILDLELASGNGVNICKFIYDNQYEIPVIVYTGQDLTIEQEKEIKRYADSIILKTANSDDRLLDEVTLFLHRIKKNRSQNHYLVSKTNKQHALTLEGKKILIADDDPRNIFVLASALENFGAEILEAENGKAALELLEHQKVDLILMDIMMPIMDGYQTIKEIRSNESGRSIPIIAVTAKSLKDDRAKCITAGANDYISKPVDYDTLVRLVKAWINK